MLREYHISLSCTYWVQVFDIWHLIYISSDLFLHSCCYSKVLYCYTQEKKVYDGHCKYHVIKSPWSTYYIHSLLDVFLISIFPYTSYFEFLIQGLCKQEIKSILDFRNSLTISIPRLKCAQDLSVLHWQLLIIWIFSVSLKFGAYLHHGSVGRTQSKECYFKCMLTFYLFFVVFCFAFLSSFLSLGHTSKFQSFKCQSFASFPICLFLNKNNTLKILCSWS